MPAGFVDYLRRVLGWLSSERLGATGPFTVELEQVYSGGSRESQSYSAGSYCCQTFAGGSTGCQSFAGSSLYEQEFESGSRLSQTGQ